MDESISSIIGAVIFTAFVAGLAESIGSVPFWIIVLFVIALMSIDTVQIIKTSWGNYKNNNNNH